MAIGDVNPAQEHFVSNLIRQKIIAATDNLPNTFNPKAKRFLLLLPEGEWHELGLLFAQYLLKEANHEVIYLGQSVPYSDVLATGAVKDFDCILVSSTTPQPEFDFIVYLKILEVHFLIKRSFISPVSWEKILLSFTESIRIILQISSTMS